MTTQQIETPEKTVVLCNHGNRRSFLEIVPQVNRVRVQPTHLGKARLNRFWSMWLRELILTKTDARHGFAVELYHRNVIVSSSTTPIGLRETVRSLAADVRPLMIVPLKRWNDKGPRHSPNSYGPIQWAITYPGLSVQEIIDKIPLPKGATLHYVSGDSLWHNNHTYGALHLEYRGSSLSGSELGMLVELHFSLACNE